MKKILASVLVLSTFVTSIGCVGSNTSNGKETTKKEEPLSTTSTTTSNAEWKIGDKIGDNLSLDWYLNLGWWEYTNDWNSYPIPKEIADITGVTPKIIIPTGDGTEKVNLMIATDTLPDLITLGLADPLVSKLIDQGYVIAFDELLDTYAPSFKTEIMKEPVWNYLKHDDGKIYGYSSYFVKQKEKLGAATFNVKKDYYKELGSPDMSTPESFIASLKAFKEKYPTIDGKESIPLTVGTEWYRFMLENPFGVKDFYVDDSGKVTTRYKDPKYVDVAKFYNLLYREGLLDPEIFIKQDNQVNEDLASGLVFCYPTNYWDLDSVNSALDKEKEDSHFIAIEPLQATSDVTFPGVGRLGWTITMINKNSPKKDIAIKFASYMFSKEGNLLMGYGHEGKDYTINGDTITRSIEIENEMGKDLIAFNTKTGMNTFRLFNYPYYRDVPAIPFVEDKQNRIDLAGKYVRDNTILTYKMLPDPTSAEGIIYTKIDDIYKKTWPQMVMAKSEAEALDLLEKMVSDMEKAGLADLEVYWTKRHQQNIEQFKDE